MEMAAQSISARDLVKLILRWIQFLNFREEPDDATVMEVIKNINLELSTWDISTSLIYNLREHLIDFSKGNLATRPENYRLKLGEGPQADVKIPRPLAIRDVFTWSGPISGPDNDKRKVVEVDYETINQFRQENHENYLPSYYNYQPNRPYGLLVFDALVSVDTFVEIHYKSGFAGFTGPDDVMELAGTHINLLKANVAVEHLAEEMGLEITPSMREIHSRLNREVRSKTKTQMDNINTACLVGAPVSGNRRNDGRARPYRTRNSGY